MDKVILNINKGILYYSNGDRYKGGYSEDKRFGQGVLNYANGNKYDGEWKEGKRNGKGIIEYYRRHVHYDDWGTIYRRLGQ